VVASPRLIVHKTACQVTRAVTHMATPTSAALRAGASFTPSPAAQHMPHGRRRVCVNPCDLHISLDSNACAWAS
jgi:hypothetical protein